MPSAPPAVLELARYVAPPVSDEGAAAMLERLVLAAPRVAAANARRLDAGRTVARGRVASQPGGSNQPAR
jgi:hypothetical protein